MAKDMAILRLLKRNYKIRSAFQRRIQQEQNAQPVQVDPYMFKKFFQELQMAEAESNGG